MQNRNSLSLYQELAINPITSVEMGANSTCRQCYNLFFFFFFNWLWQAAVGSSSVPPSTFIACSLKTLGLTATSVSVVFTPWQKEFSFSLSQYYYSIPSILICFFRTVDFFSVLFCRAWGFLFFFFAPSDTVAFLHKESSLSINSLIFWLIIQLMKKEMCFAH